MFSSTSFPDLSMQTKMLRLANERVSESKRQSHRGQIRARDDHQPRSGSLAKSSIVREKSSAREAAPYVDEFCRPVIASALGKGNQSAYGVQVWFERPNQGHLAPQDRICDFRKYVNPEEIIDRLEVPFTKILEGTATKEEYASTMPRMADMLRKQGYKHFKSTPMGQRLLTDMVFSGNQLKRSQGLQIVLDLLKLGRKEHVTILALQIDMLEGGLLDIATDAIRAGVKAGQGDKMDLWVGLIREISHNFFKALDRAKAIGTNNELYVGRQSFSEKAQAYVQSHLSQYEGYNMDPYKR
jgi:hypothetical protein